MATSIWRMGRVSWNWSTNVHPRLPWWLGMNHEPVSTRDSVRPTRQIQSGDLLAWENDHYTGWNRFVVTFVRFMTLSEYGHVGVAHVRDGVVYALEAVNPVVRIQPIPVRSKIYVVSMNIQDTTKLYDHIQKYVGRPYSILDCIRAYLGVVTKSDDRWQCAELANEIYSKLGIDLKPKRITPSGVVEAALRHSHSSLWIY